MSTTISTSGSPPDIDGKIVSGVESLSQRIRSAYRFRFREWFAAPGEGLDYDLIFRHQLSLAQTAQVLLNVIRDEGGREVRNIRDVQFSRNPTTRRYTFSCVVETINGDMTINEELG